MTRDEEETIDHVLRGWWLGLLLLLVVRVCRGCR